MPVQGWAGRMAAPSTSGYCLLSARGGVGTAAVRSPLCFHLDEGKRRGGGNEAERGYAPPS